MALLLTFTKLVVALQAIAHPRLALKLGALAAEKALLLVCCPLVAGAALLAVAAVIATARAGRGATPAGAGPVS